VNLLVKEPGGNARFMTLRAKGPVCRAEPLGYLGFLRWAGL
jgi:hypothetical protein